MSHIPNADTASMATHTEMLQTAISPPTAIDFYMHAKYSLNGTCEPQAWCNKESHRQTEQAGLHKQPAKGSGRSQVHGVASDASISEWGSGTGTSQ